MCKICGRQSEPFGRARLLGKYDVQYLRCSDCGLIQVEKPYWLEEAYSEAIAASDLGLLGRNIGLAVQTQTIITCFFNAGAKFVDYGGGYGVLTRLMRDAGFDFYRHDRYCPNLFAKGFDAELDGSTCYELLTAYEVLEHLIEPVEGLTAMLRLSDSVLFTTVLVPSPAPGPNDWWYYALDTGQHVSFYTHRSLLKLAATAGLTLCSNGNLHLMSKRQISPLLFRSVTRSRAISLIRRFGPRRQSLQPQDYKRVSGKKIE